MQASTEQMLRRKLAEDMAESDFNQGIVKFCAAFALLLLVVMFFTRLTHPAPPSQQSAPQAQQHKRSQYK